MLAVLGKRAAALEHELGESRLHAAGLQEAIDAREEVAEQQRQAAAAQQRADAVMVEVRRRPPRSRPPPAAPQARLSAACSPLGPPARPMQQRRQSPHAPRMRNCRRHCLPQSEKEVGYRGERGVWS